MNSPDDDYMYHKGVFRNFFNSLTLSRITRSLLRSKDGNLTKDGTQRTRLFGGSLYPQREAMPGTPPEFYGSSFAPWPELNFSQGPYWYFFVWNLDDSNPTPEPPEELLITPIEDPNPDGGVGPVEKEMPFGPADCGRARPRYTRATPHPRAPCDEVVVPVFGACCYDNGDCDFTSETECTNAGGDYAGNDVTCAAADCPPPIGACCTTGTCTDDTEADCLGGGGEWYGFGTACADDPTLCELPTEACCYLDGTCEDLTPGVCAFNGGVSQGVDSECASTECPVRGGCCRGNGNCSNNVLESDCQGTNDTYMGDGVSCVNADCRGACCRNANGLCTAGVGPTTCQVNFAGVFQGLGTTCTPNPCPVTNTPCCATSGSECFASSCVSGICSFTISVTWSLDVLVQACCGPGFNSLTQYTHTINQTDGTTFTFSETFRCDFGFNYQSVYVPIAFPTCFYPDDVLGGSCTVSWNGVTKQFTAKASAFTNRAGSDRTPPGSLDVINGTGSCSGFSTAFPPGDGGGSATCFQPVGVFNQIKITGGSVTVTITDSTVCP